MGVMRSARSGHAPTALVTGASSGIGYELARLCARDGYDVVLVARGRETLAALAEELTGRCGVRATVLAMDLAEPAVPGLLAAALAQAGLQVDLLMNNAGVGRHGPFAESDLTTELRMIQVNISALTALTKLLLPGMLARRAGRVLNVASTAAFAPGPFMAVYYATKAYVLSFSEALAEELRGTGVTVTALCPGPTWTAFQARAGIEQSRLIRTRVGIMDAATVARAGYRGCLRGQRLVIPGWANTLVARGTPILPRSWVARVVRALNE